MIFVAFSVAPELRRPILLSRCGSMCHFTIVRMPKTPVDEDYLVSCSEHEVGSAGELMIVKPVSVAQPVHESPDCELRDGVFAFDSAHVFAALLGGQAVHDPYCRP
jgi:hypothetical protein